MSIRIRRVEGTIVALCAARSVPKPGDIYLNDAAHYALAQKFARDYGLGFAEAHDHAVADREESDNENRAAWDARYGTTIIAAPGGPASNPRPGAIAQAAEPHRPGDSSPGGAA